MPKVFVVKDPTPWFDQFVSSIQHMVYRNRGLSQEFVMNGMLRGVRDPNQLILAAVEDDDHADLAGWMFAIFVQDTYKPWVEVWGLWSKPGRYHEMAQEAFDTLVEWATYKGATRLVCTLHRAPQVYLKKFFAPLGFAQTGIVIERSL